LGASLTQRAQELSAKAAAELTKAKEQYAVVNSSNAPVNNSSSDAANASVPSSLPSDSASDTADLLQLGDAVVVAEGNVGSRSGNAPPALSATVSPGATATVADSVGPNGVSREELLEVLNKMNKKVKVLSMQKQQLLEQNRAAQEAKDRIRTFVVEEILNGGPPGFSEEGNNEEDVRQLQLAWRAQDEQNSLALQQLQSEFQKLRLAAAQNSQNGDNSPSSIYNGSTTSSSSSWEAERTQLIEQHQREMEALRESISSKPQNQQQAKPPPTTPASASTGDGPASEAASGMEVQKVKDAAAAQIEALKKKFVIAHNSGIVKLRAELQDEHRRQAEQLTGELEARHREEVERIRAEHEQELEAAIARQQQPAARASPSPAEELDRLKAAHADELRRLEEAAEARLAAQVERARQEGEQAATTHAEEKLQDLLGQLSSKHRDEIEQLRQKSAGELSRKLSEARTASDESTKELRAQLELALGASEEARRTLLERSREASLALEKQWTDRFMVAQAELAELRQQSDLAAAQARSQEATIRSLEERLQEAMRQCEVTRRVSEDEAASKVEELARLRASLELTSQLEERLRAEHSAEQESLRKALEQQSHEFQETLAIERQKHTEALELAVSAATGVKSDDGSSSAVELSALLAENDAKFAVERLELREAALRAKDEAETAVRAEMTAELDRAAAEYRKAVQDLEKRAYEANVELRASQGLAEARGEQLEAVRRQLDDATAETAALKAASQDLERSTDAQLQENLSKRQQDHDRTVNELKDEVKQAVSAHQESMSQVDSLKSQVSKMEEQKASLLKDLHELKARAEAAEVAAQQAQAGAQARIEASKAESVAQNEEMRKSMEAHVDKMKAHFLARAEAAKEASSGEIKSLQEALKDKDDKLTKLVERLKSITASTANLKNENEELKLKLASEGNIQSALRSELQTLQHSMDETVSNSSATATSLLQQQESLETEKLALQRQVSELKTSQEELSGKLRALTANLNIMVEERNDSHQKLAAAVKLEAKLAASEAEVAGLRDQINKMKLDLTQNSSLVTRLLSEKDATERAQGERTALVGMLESRLAESSDKVSDLHAKLEASLYDLSQRDEALRSSEDRVRQLEGEIAEARSATKRAVEALAVAHKGAEAKSTKTFESLQKELQSVRQQMARKSAAAQKLLQEREAECAELRKANARLQQEVDKGSLSDRRIFELAAKQSNRESQQASEIEIRNKTIETMKTALLERDGELAHAEKKVLDVESQVEELCRVRRREDVNLDYLKDIVVKYLSLPPGSSERARLLPVLATLLQFNAHDYQTIEEGKKKVSWWGSVSPTLISAPDAAATHSQSGSAEVLVNRDPQAQTRTTSLQF
jgi:hypothetical protein